MPGSDAAEIDPIRHVVLLMLENRSFDQMLGCLRAVYPALDGIDPGVPHKNVDHDGRSYFQAPMQARQMLKWDPHHEVSHVAVQLTDDNGGFVKDFSASYPDSTQAARALIMGYYPLDFLPGLHRLAKHFTICDRWFSSLPGPTWPNRFFALSGTANGRTDMPSDGTHGADLPGFFEQTQTTLFDRLNDRGVHWKVYFHDIPQTTVFTNQRLPHNAARYFYVDEFFDDARGSEAEFPQFCLIEPDYMGYGQSDAHPPHDIMRSEKLIADVFNAIRANDSLWNATLLVVMYDEHGGFYDHVAPPPAQPPDDEKSDYAFDRYGVRVPAILVSPFARAGVESTLFDHTSLLKYLIEKWSLEPLGRRAAAANSIGVALSQERREVSLARIELTREELVPPDQQAQEEAFGALNAHQSALKRLSDYLVMLGVEEAPKGWSTIARLVEWAKAALERLRDRAYDAPAGLFAPIAEPDKVTTCKDLSARNAVAEFIMRKKRYAAIGIANRIKTVPLTQEQLHHSLQTLSLLTGRNFHLAQETEQLAGALDWLGPKAK